MAFKKISVIGLGYIGLPTAAVFASRKIEVIGVDVNQKAVDTINRGEIHIVEPDLDMVVKAAVTEGYLKATTTPESADAFIIAVPTPFKEGHQPDLSYIEAASKAIAPVLKAGDLVILESTSPVGATEAMSQWMAEQRPDLSFPHLEGESSDIRVAHCPERVLPGKVMRELIENDRVIGGITPKCSEASIALYDAFVQGECVVTDARTAEMAKLTENSFRDVNIAFANELSIICTKLGINVWELIALANRHPRVNILQPGPGVGGHCIAVDPWFVISKTPDEARLIRTAREVNDNKPEVVIKQILEKAERFKRAKIAFFGAAFKANIDDLRESPALYIIEKMAKMDAGEVYVVEPNIEQLPDNIKQAGCELISIEQALKEVDIIVGLVDHKEFLKLKTEQLSSKIVLDFKGMWVTRVNN